MDKLDDWFPVVESGPFPMRMPHAFDNDIRLSVQANQGAYCNPRTNLPSLHDYNSVEIGIWRKANPREWITDKEVPELSEWYRGDIVAGYVPITDIPRVMDLLRNLP